MEIEKVKMDKAGQGRVRGQMEKAQREYYLTEKLKAIQKELGEGEDGRDETAEYEDRIKDTKLSKEARENPQTQLAPIIDGMLPGFKMAEVMATLGAVGLPPVSRLGVYEQPPVEDLKKLRRSRDQSMPAWADGERTS